MIIALYAPHRNCGVSVATFAIVQGLLADGHEVCVAEIGSKFTSARLWCPEFSEIENKDIRCSLHFVESHQSLEEFRSHVRKDPRRYGIIETTNQVSSERTHAFEIADVVVMPFMDRDDLYAGDQWGPAQVPKPIVGLRTNSVDRLLIPPDLNFSVLKNQIPRHEWYEHPHLKSPDAIDAVIKKRYCEPLNSVRDVAREILNYEKATHPIPVHAPKSPNTRRFWRLHFG